MSMAAMSHCLFKLICGAVVDVYVPRTVWSLALATANSGFPSLVMIAWVAYRAFHSFVWPSMIAALSRFEGSGFTTALGILTTSCRVGGVMGGFFAAICL